MVTADAVKAAWEAIVTSHKSQMAFLSIWTAPLDDSIESALPVCIWHPLTTSCTMQDQYIQDNFAVAMEFLEQTDPDRSTDERDGAHSSMDAVARQCFYRFADLYINDTGTVIGQTLDFTTTASPTFSPVYDDGPHHLTGVRMEVTLTANQRPYCLTDYFS